METIADSIKEIVDKKEFEMSENQKNANQKYQDLLKKGLIQKPEYTLMGLERYTRART